MSVFVPQMLIYVLYGARRYEGQLHINSCAPEESTCTHHAGIQTALSLPQTMTLIDSSDEMVQVPNLLAHPSSRFYYCHDHHTTVQLTREGARATICCHFP